MANFKTHITTSTVLGIGYGAMGYLAFNIPWESSLIASGLCGVSGMLPDLDSDSGVPVRETLSFVSAVVPMLMIRRFSYLQFTHEQIIVVGALTYIVIRFGIGKLFRRFTVHRGMWHSIPAALIAGLIAFLLCVSSDLQIRLFKAWAVVIGYLSHLILDEMYSVDLSGHRIRLKRSLGTALKFWGGSTWWNISTYLKLAVLAGLVWLDPTVQSLLQQKGIETPAVAKALPNLGESLPKILWR